MRKGSIETLEFCFTEKSVNERPYSRQLLKSEEECLVKVTRLYANEGNTSVQNYDYDLNFQMFLCKLYSL